MALVAYDNSDSSDYEDEDITAPVVELLKKPDVAKCTINAAVPNESDSSNEAPTDGPDLFNRLPQPSTKKPAVIEEDDEFLHKKENVTDIKPRAKITVPSLSDFKDVESSTPSLKLRAPNGKKSGLLSILPQPKNAFTTTTKSLIPQVLNKKPDNVKKKALPSPVKNMKIDTQTHLSDDSDDDFQNDFFSINKPVEFEELPELPVDNIIESEPPVADTRSKFESYFKKDVVENTIEPDNSIEMEYGEASSSYSNEVVAPVPENNDQLELDEEAILKLCGARGKRRREDIQIVDVNQDQVLANAREMLMKGIMDDTSRRVSSSKKRGNEPTSQQKRKHQITYLAHQAKANEAELQNQWANNRMTKRKTQSKYGF